MNKNHEQNQPIHYVAIDISKNTLQIQHDNGSFTLANDSSGIEKLIIHLKTCHHPLAVFEATGGYERPLLEALRKAGLPMAMVNPARVRDFARSEGIRAKTDPIDARMILTFAKSKQLKPMAAPSAACIKLASLHQANVPSPGKGTRGHRETNPNAGCFRSRPEDPRPNH